MFHHHRDREEAIILEEARIQAAEAQTIAAEANLEARMAYGAPGYAGMPVMQPGYVQPGYVQPGYGAPGYGVAPGYVQPGYGAPTMGQEMVMQQELRREERELEREERELEREERREERRWF